MIRKRCICSNCDRLIGEVNSIPIRSDHQPGASAAEKDLRVVNPGRWLDGSRAWFLKLFFQPRDVAMQKISRHHLRPAAWNGHARHAIGSHAQDVSAGSSIPDKANRDGSRIKDQTFLSPSCRTEYALKRIELHGAELNRGVKL